MPSASSPRFDGAYAGGYAENEKNVVTIPVPRFFSLVDKENFFQWLYSLRAFRTVKGAGKELCITFRTSRLSFRDSDELIAIFSRYDLDKRVLFAPAKKWSAPKPDWLKDVFRK